MSAGALSAGERSYPISEVRGSDRECQAAMAQERQRGATLCPRSGAKVWRSYPAYEARDHRREEQPCVRGQGQRPGTSTHAQGVVAALAQEGLEELSHTEGQEGQR